QSRLEMTEHAARASRWRAADKLVNKPNRTQWRVYGSCSSTAAARRASPDRQTRSMNGIFERAAEPHLDAFARVHDFPGIGAIQPVVWPLLLPSIANALVEHAVLVAQSVTHCRKLQGRHRIEEARRQTAEPAVAEPCIWFFVEQLD